MVLELLLLASLAQEKPAIEPPEMADPIKVYNLYIEYAKSLQNFIDAPENIFEQDEIKALRVEIDALRLHKSKATQKEIDTLTDKIDKDFEHLSTMDTLYETWEVV